MDDDTCFRQSVVLTVNCMLTTNNLDGLSRRIILSTYNLDGLPHRMKRARAAAGGARRDACGARRPVAIAEFFLIFFFNLCHVPRSLSHGEVQIFTVCQDPWHTTNFESGAVSSRRYHSPWTSPPSCALVCHVPPQTHGKGLCRVPDKRHTAKSALPSRLVAVEDSSWTAHDKNICCVF